MNEIFKGANEKDSRALKEAFFYMLDSGVLRPFVDLVTEDNRLEMCFRGNENPNQAVIIYYKNHQLFKILDTGKIAFNYNHARYCPEDREKEYRTKLREKGFVIEDKYNDKGEKDIGEVTRTMKGKTALTLGEIKSLVNDILIPMFDTFFDVTMTYDYFKKGNKKTKGELAEKEDQQELFTKMTKSSAGFFFYDMEIAKKHESRDAIKNDEFNNKADMMAVEFDSKGEPRTIFFVEVKTKKTAFRGDSGLDEHIKKMKETTEEEIENKRKEAYKIINQYHLLGLRKVDCVENICYEKISKMKKGILIVLSREAIEYWKEYQKTSKYKFEKCCDSEGGFEVYRVVE